VAGAAVAEAEAAASAADPEDRRPAPALIDARAQVFLIAEPGRRNRVFEAPR
jgi:hypothetical protein